MSELLTTRELSEYLKLSKITIYNYIHDGKISGFKVGRRWMFDKDRIDTLMIKKGRRTQ